MIYYSEKECKSLQLHEDQIKHCKSDELSAVKSKSSRSKYRKTPYHVPKVSTAAQPPLPCHYTPPSPARNLTDRWCNSKANFSAFNWNSYISQPHPLNRNPSPGSSSNSCYDDTIVDQQSHDSSPVLREDYVNYWKPHNSNCGLFGAFDTSTVPEDLYKAAYGSYYQRLAATAARTYGHMTNHMTNHNKISEFYYPSTYCGKLT